MSNLLEKLVEIATTLPVGVGIQTKEQHRQVQRERIEAALAGVQPAQMIKHMVDRFLQWKLPENFNPDCGISFKADFNEHTSHPMKHEPVGTNLFDATQAEEMVRYLVDGMPLTKEPVRDLKPLDGTDWKYDYQRDRAWIDGREFAPVVASELLPKPENLKWFLDAANKVIAELGKQEHLDSDTFRWLCNAVGHVERDLRRRPLLNAAGRKRLAAPRPDMRKLFAKLAADLREGARNLLANTCQLGEEEASKFRELSVQREAIAEDIEHLLSLAAPREGQAFEALDQFMKAHQRIRDVVNEQRKKAAAIANGKLQQNASTALIDFCTSIDEAFKLVAAPREGQADSYVQKRIEDTEGWLMQNAPHCFTEQKHLDEGTQERIYWHYGYLVALKDVTRLAASTGESRSVQRRKALQKGRAVLL